MDSNEQAILNYIAGLTTTNVNELLGWLAAFGIAAFVILLHTIWTKLKERYGRDRTQEHRTGR